VLEDFVALQFAIALRLGHVVEPTQLVEFALLNLRRQFAEAGLVLERALLIGEGKILVVFHPLL